MVQINKKRYKANDICRLFDISKATLFRWESEGLISNIKRDWRNWRSYSNENIRQIRILIRQKNTKKGESRVVSKARLAGSGRERKG